MFSRKNILVSGATSSLGIELTSQLKLKGAIVTGIGRVSPQLKSHELDRFIVHDLMEPLPNLETKYSHIFHLASTPGLSSFVDNYPLAIYSNSVIDYHMFDFAQKFMVDNFYYASSISVRANRLSTQDLYTYDMSQSLVANPDSIFGLQKRFSEVYLEKISEIANSNSVSFRLCTLYGGKEKTNSNILSAFLNSAKESKGIEIWGGDQIRTFIHVKDAATAMLTAAENHKTNCSIDIGTRDAYSIRHLAELISQIAPFPIRLDTKKYSGSGMENHLADLTLLFSYNWEPFHSLTGEIEEFFK